MSASVRGIRKSSLPLAITLAALAGAALTGAPRTARAVPDPVEAEFDSARLKDDLAGTITDTNGEVYVVFHATAGSKLTTDLRPDTRSSDPRAEGLTLALQRDDGTDLSNLVLGHDKTKPDGPVKWKKVPLDETGDYRLVIRATGAGTWRLKLAGSSLKATSGDAVALGLAPGEVNSDLTFEGLARGTVSWQVSKRTPSSKFTGEVVQIVQPDGSDLPGVSVAAKGKAQLLQDGLHRLVFRNTGSFLADGKAHADAKPPSLLKRTGYVLPAGTALVPAVKKLTPSRGFHKDAEFQLTLNGRDFQPGADVRLIRKGRQDIVGTNVQVSSETEITCNLDLNTADTEGITSIGTWKLGVWNAPVYLVEDDPTSLVTDSSTKNVRAKFTSVSSSSISLPPGVVKGTEVWHVDFNDDFQTDLNRMGLGSSDETARDQCRGAVEAYTVLFLRDLFRANETTGALKKNTSVPICFLVAKPNPIAGKPGVDYNRIEVGGAYETGDERDVAEPLLWGYAPIDEGNSQRENLSVNEDDGAGGTVRVGRGARTRVLDTGSAAASSSWVLATAPLRVRPLGFSDRRYFAPNFSPNSQGEADRYKEIVEQLTRASREIAAVIAHHVGKAMGIEDGVPDGPMANPAVAGGSWVTTTSLQFTDSETLALTGSAVPSALPGSSRTLQVTYFPINTTHYYLLEDCVTVSPYTTYSARFGFVGGRPNALLSDWRAQYVSGTLPPSQLKLSYLGLDGDVPVTPTGNINDFTCYAALFKVAITDTVRGGSRIFIYRLDTYPDITKMPPALQPQVLQCIRSLPTK